PPPSTAVPYTPLFRSMGTDDFRDRVAELSRTVGEGGWPMPLPEELRDGLDSEVADLTHVTPHRWGGMLSAGLFLSEFVAEGVEWAHVDVRSEEHTSELQSRFDLVC